MESDAELVDEIRHLILAAPDCKKKLFDASNIGSVRRGSAMRQLSHKHRPQYFTMPPPPGDELRAMQRKEAYAKLPKRQAEQLLNSEELNELRRSLQQFITETTNKNQLLINHDDYRQLQAAVGEKCRKYLTAQLFAQLLSDSPYLDTVEIFSIYDYIIKKVWLAQCRIELAYYDEVGQGYLREFDMGDYIVGLIPTLLQIADYMPKWFEKFYVCTAVKRFFFHLDPTNTGRIRIIDILSSGILDELLELRKEEQLTEHLPRFNWFAMSAVLEVYSYFLDLDEDQNGLLSKQELARYGSGTLSSVFLDRVFEECPTYDRELDYKTFLDFVLALENRQLYSGLHFIFRLLDVQHTGYLTAQTLHFFLKAMGNQLPEEHKQTLNLEDMSREIFDMVGPKDPSKITLQDLMNCGQADTAVSILIEFHKFWTYKNRENLQNA